MIGEVQYGGRVTDDYDKRLLNTFTRVWLSDSIFDCNFMFYKGYPIFNYKQVSNYVIKIQELPTTDPPQAYGLHSNADIT
jgi:dynein heavy chain